MITILAILIIFIIVVLTKVLNYDYYPHGKNTGHPGAPSFEGRWDALNREDERFAAWFRAVSGGLSYNRKEINNRLYSGSSIYG